MRYRRQYHQHHHQHRLQQQRPPPDALNHGGLAAPPASHQLRQRSVTSNNSSLSSSVSPTWTMTNRPQTMGTAWPEDDALTEDGDRDATNGSSSWQEEAHWLSWRLALSHFATQTIDESSPKASSLDGNVSASSSRVSRLSFIEHPSPPLSHIEEIISPPNLPKLPTNPINTRPTNLTINTDLEEEGSSSFSNNSSSAGDQIKRKNRHDTSNKRSKDESSSSKLQSMASELSETKMRLALAQAERDELEFALMMSSQSDSR